jgi:2-amino-4-hydroxy-6-hydroxymethyldihydropteridine diphosphokinase
VTPVSEREGSDEPRLCTAFLGLGSNLGDRVRNLERALEGLRRHIALEAVSSIYETEPVGVRDQPWFLNLVCVGTTRLKPMALLEFVQELETALGRARGERWGPRAIDIDILAYDDRIVREADLQIPHPRMTERVFVLEPLAEIAPDWRHPELGKTALELREALAGEEVRLYGHPPPLSGPAPLV